MPAQYLDPHLTEIIPLTPSAPECLPETVSTTCPHCEEGGVLVGQGEDYEHWQDCKLCSGEGSETLYRCETCDTLVTEHELDNANVCMRCYQDGLKAVEDDPEYEKWRQKQIEFGESVDWL